MNANQITKLKDIGQSLGVKPEDITDIVRERKRRRLRIGIGTAISAGIGAALGYYIGLISPPKETSGYPLTTTLAIAATIPGPMHKAVLGRRRGGNVTYIGVVMTCIACVAFFIFYLLGASRATPVPPPSIMYGVTHTNGGAAETRPKG